MARKLEYFEELMGREFYEFYKKTRKKPSKNIDQYNYFVKAVRGLCIEMKAMLNETEHGIHLKGLGIFYKRPFGEYFEKLNLFTRAKRYKKSVRFYLEDDYLRNLYLITNVPKDRTSKAKIAEDKSSAVLLHRKLKLKK